MTRLIIYIINYEINQYILFFAAISIVSCKQSPPPHKYDGPDTVAYTYREFKVRDNACGNNPDTACTIIKLNYPDFNGTRKALSDSITRKFIQLFAQDKAKNDTGKTQLAADFISRYTDFKKNEPKINAVLFA